VKSLVKYGLVIIWALLLLTPPVTYFVNRGGLLADPKTLFPLFGLLALSLVWSQIMLGAFMRPLTKLYPKILKLHIAFGLLTLAFALLHPLLLIVGYTPAGYFGYTFVAPELKSAVFLGQGALLLLLLGILAGLLRNWKPLQKAWRWLHFGHYAVFFLAFFHSMRLGTDLSISPYLRVLWLFFFVTVVIAMVYRRFYVPNKTS
jgi:hypothetical protein